MNTYLIILLFMVLCIGNLYEVFTNNESKVSALFALCIFVLLVALRNIDSPDTREYIKAYDAIGFDNMHYGDFNIGFVFLICIFKYFDANVRYFFAFLAIFNYATVYFVCRSIYEEYSIVQFKNGVVCKKIRAEFKPCIFSSLFIPYFGLFYSGVALRASIAMSFVLVSYVFLYRQKYLGYFFFLVIAMLFHSSAILGILLLICDKFTSGKKQTYLFMWLGSVLIWLSHIGLFIIKIVPFTVRKIYEITNIDSFKLYELFYASSIRKDGFFGKKELFFLLCSLFFVVMKWDNGKMFQKLLIVLFLGIILAFSLEYLTNSYRIIDFFLMFFVPCGCIVFGKARCWNELVNNSFSLLIMIFVQLMITMNIIGFT